MKVIRECGRARNAQGWRKLGPRGLCGNSNLGQPPYICTCFCLMLRADPSKKCQAKDAEPGAAWEPVVG